MTSLENDDLSRSATSPDCSSDTSEQVDFQSSVINDFPLLLPFQEEEDWSEYLSAVPQSANSGNSSSRMTQLKNEYGVEQSYEQRPQSIFTFEARAPDQVAQGDEFEERTKTYSEAVLFMASGGSDSASSDDENEMIREQQNSCQQDDAHIDMKGENSLGVVHESVQIHESGDEAEDVDTSDSEDETTAEWLTATVGVESSDSYEQLRSNIILREQWNEAIDEALATSQISEAGSSNEAQSELQSTDKLLPRIEELEQNQKLFTKCKKRNFRKIWKQFDVVKSETDKIIKKVLMKLDIVEHAIANSYKIYDEETFKLRRRVEQMETENGLLKERLKISNMLACIRDNTASISQEERPGHDERWVTARKRLSVNIPNDGGNSWRSKSHKTMEESLNKHVNGGMEKRQISISDESSSDQDNSEPPNATALTLKTKPDDSDEQSGASRSDETDKPDDSDEQSGTSRSDETDKPNKLGETPIIDPEGDEGIEQQPDDIKLACDPSNKNLFEKLCSKTVNKFKKNKRRGSTVDAKKGREQDDNTIKGESRQDGGKCRGKDKKGVEGMNEAEGKESTSNSGSGGEEDRPTVNYVGCRLRTW